MGWKPTARCSFTVTEEFHAGRRSAARGAGCGRPRRFLGAAAASSTNIPEYPSDVVAHAPLLDLSPEKEVPPPPKLEPWRST